MAHTLRSSAQSTYGPAAPHTLSFNCLSGATLLVVGVLINSTTVRAGGAPTFNGVAMTSSGYTLTQGGGETGCELWYMINPPNNQAYTISVPNTGGLNIILHVASFAAAAGYTSAPYGANGVMGESANPSVNVTASAAGNAVFAVMTNGFRNVGTPNHTGLNTYDAGNQTFHDQYFISTGSGTVTMSWTQNIETWEEIVVIFNEQAVPARSINKAETISVADVRTVSVQEPTVGDVTIPQQNQPVSVVDVRTVAVQGAVEYAVNKADTVNVGEDAPVVVQAALDFNVDKADTVNVGEDAPVVVQDAAEQTIDKFDAIAVAPWINITHVLNVKI